MFEALRRTHLLPVLAAASLLIVTGCAAIAADVSPWQDDAQSSARLISARAVKESGGGMFRAGVNGVGSPVCIYCPQPEYSDEARKAKYQGTVLLDVTVTADGRVLNPQVLKGPGLGLEEKAMAQVKNWKMRPAVGPSGKPVNCRVQIEVTFHLY